MFTILGLVNGESKIADYYKFGGASLSQFLFFIFILIRSNGKAIKCNVNKSSSHIQYEFSLQASKADRQSSV